MKPVFNRNPLEGQLTIKEREALFNKLLVSRPKIVVEIGTWKGGGSTYIVTCALHELNAGILYSVEIDKELHEYAVKLYLKELVDLLPFVKLLLGNSLEVLPPIVQQERAVNFLILDGKEDSQQTVSEFVLLNKYMTSGALLFCHDWLTAKMHLLKAVLEESPSWKLDQLIMGGPTGAAIWQKI